MDCRQKASAVLSPAPVRVPSKKPLAPSIISASDKEDEMIPEAVHGICLTPEENHGKLHLGDHLIKGIRPVIASNGVPYFQMSSIESHSISGREKEGKIGGLDTFWLIVQPLLAGTGF